MYVIGIDVSKYKHDCIILKEDTGEIVRDVFSIENSRSGFNQLLEVLKTLDPKIKKKIGFESTGHYQDNLKIFLANEGFDFMELNALLVHKFKSSQTLRGVKTDKTDARLIANYLCKIEFKPYSRIVYNILALRSLCKRHFDLITERTRYLIRITDFLDRTFPELKSFLNNNLKSKTAMFILHNYGVPNKIANLNTQSYEKLRKESHGRFTVAKFNKLKELAKNTIDFSYETDIFEINSLLRSYDLINEEISFVENEISTHLSKINSKILTIKGIGLVSAATLIAEIEDISRFDSPDKLLAFAGLDPRIYQSGTKDVKGKMNKRGSVILRRTIMNCAESLLIYNPIFTTIIARNEMKARLIESLYRMSQEDL